MGEVRQPTYTVTDPATGKTVTKTSRVWWIRYYRGGKRFEESAKTTKKTVAKALLKSREGKVADGVPIAALTSRMTFDDAVADVVADYTMNGRRTATELQARIDNHLLPIFGGRRLTLITAADLRAYAAARRKAGAAPATVNRELAIVRRAFRLAQEAGKLAYVPRVRALHEHNVRQGFFERPAFEAIRAALPAALRPIVTLAYVTGWRVASEILPLEWTQVDREARVIRLEPGSTKNREGRTLPYGQVPELVTLIADQWAAHEALAKTGTICPFVFHRDGRRIRWFRGAWRRACEAAGYPGKLLHDFRRTAVRNLARAGVPNKTAMGITGHKTESVYLRYDIVTEADLADALGKLTEATAGKEKGKTAGSGKVRRFRKTAVSA